MKAFRSVLVAAISGLALFSSGLSSPHAAPAPELSSVEQRFGAASPAVTPSALVFAQAASGEFPGGKPVTIIVPYPAGGVTDTGARWMAEGLEKELKAPIQVINVAGAAGQVALTQLVRSPPDGYTVGYAILPNAITHYLDPSRGAIYTRESFETIGNHHLAGIVLAVRSESPYKSLKDLVEAARAKPETITVADSGLLANPHLQVMVLEHITGAKFASTHFAGGAPSVAALLGGHVDVLAASTADVLSHLKAGTFRVLAVASQEPDPFMPDVPTMKSLGYDIVLPAVTGIVAPKGTPEERIEILSAAMKRVIEGEQHRKQLEGFGLVPHYLDPEGFEEAWIDSEERVTPVLKSVNVVK